MTHSLLWILSFFVFAFIGCECIGYSRFDIAISFINISTKLSTSVFNLSVSNYCIGGIPQSDRTSDDPTVYRGDLVRLKWHSKQNENGTLDDKCLLSFPSRAYHSPWIAVIIEDNINLAGCPLSDLLNQSTFINASAILFLRDSQAAFNQPAAHPPTTSYSSSPSLYTPFTRHYLGRLQRNRGGLEQGGGWGGFTLPSQPPLLISLPLDMFSDLPSQLAIASSSPQVSVTGNIALFVEPTTIFNLSTAEANNAADLSSSLLLLLIVCVLFLLLGILLVPARLGICFWQRFCSFSISRSAKSRRSRKLTAATKKALKKLPVRCLNQVDPLISEGFDQCAICIELFKPNDLIRSLPCRHIYHRACIDPWLLKHRSCPLCKQNILIACGLALTKDDIESCSATTSEVNSAFSLSSTSIPASISSPGADGAVICLPLLTILNCRRRRRRRRQHPYRYTEHLRRPSSSLDEISTPSAVGGRRVLGSASENSSSRSVPSDLYFHGNLGSEKGARFAVEEYEQEGSFFAGRRRWGRSRFPMFRQGRLRHGWRTRNLMLRGCCCCSSSRGTGQMAKEREVIPLPPQQRPSSPFMYPLPPSMVHPSTMLLYHLPKSLPFTQVPSVTKAALPSYEQATASMPQAAFVALPGPHQPPPAASWNPQFTAEAHQQLAATRLFDPQPPPNRSGAKTNVVYAVLSNSTARMSVTGGPSPTNLAANKLSIFVDVNPPLTRSPGSLFMTPGRGPVHQCHLAIAASAATADSQALVVKPRGESPPPAYSLATGEKLTTANTSLHPIRRAARFLATHFLSPQPVKQFQQRQHQHHYSHHQQLQSRHHYYTSFLSAFKSASHSHHHQHGNAKVRLKTRTPRRLHEVTSAAIVINRTSRRHSHRGHGRGDRECQRGAGSNGGGVLAKTLDLTHEGLIMTDEPMGSGSINLAKMPSAGEVISSSIGHGNSTKSDGPSQRLVTHSNSETSSDGTHHGLPLRHIRVRSVRVTVEPQIPYHTERDVASCEALHNTSLHTLSGSKISLPRASSLPLSLNSANSDVRIKVDDDGLPTTAVWLCRSSAGSAPALCRSPNSGNTHNHKPHTDILNRSDTILHASSSSSSS